MSHILKNNYIFSTNTSNTQIRVKGYKTVHNGTAHTYKYNENNVIYSLTYNNLNATPTVKEWVGFTFPTKFLQSNNIPFRNGDGDIQFYISSTGKIMYKSLTGGNVTRSIYVDISWNY